MKKFRTVAEYVALQPKEVEGRLRQIRGAVRKAAPKAEEMMSYGIIGYKCEGRLVYVGAFKKHIGMYPTTSAAVKAFPMEMKKYRTSTGTLQFPHDQKLPLPFITKFVKFRLRENLAKKKVIKKK